MSTSTASVAPGAAPLPAGPGMREQVRRGVAWKVASGVLNQVSRLAVAAILAHLLSPHDYGLAGMVLAMAGLVLVFADLALGTALVQREHLTEDDRSTVFWTTAAGGVLFTVGGWMLAGPVAAFYGEPQVEPLLKAMSMGFVVASLAAVQTAMLTREMNFRSLELRQMAAGLTAGVVGITAAASGAGAWAIIAQQLTALVVSTVLLWTFSSWHPHLRWSWASLRDLGGYGGNVFGSRLLFYLNRNADNLLIGRFLGPAALGAYAIAYNLMLVPLSQISLPLQEVLFPAFSRMQDDKARMTSAWLRANRLIAAITIPGMLGLVAIAPDFVAVVLGDQWKPAVPVLQVLAWVGLLQSLQGLNGTVLRAVDQTGTLLRYAVIVLVASLAAFVAGLPFGVLGVAVAYAVMSTFVEPYYTWLTTRALGTTLRAFVGALSGVTQAAVMMFAVVLAARAGLLSLDAPAGVRLLTCIAVGVVAFAGAAMWRAPELIAEIREQRRRRM
jgi:O-antigen/teichoic acid export membrane protein